MPPEEPLEPLEPLMPPLLDPELPDFDEPLPEP